jgi:hypothetical protein
MAFHQRILEDIAMYVPYEDTDEQRQAVWDAEMLLKDLRPLYRQLSLKVRRYRKDRSKYLLTTLERRKIVHRRLNQAEDILAWSLGH